MQDVRRVDKSAAMWYNSLGLRGDPAEHGEIMYRNHFYWDFSAQAEIPPDKAVMIKKNCFTLASVLNGLMKAIAEYRKNPQSNAIDRYRKENGKHEFVRCRDADTGMETYSFSKRLRFLTEYLTELPDRSGLFCARGFGKALTCLYSGYNAEGADQALCDRRYRWSAYRMKPTGDPAFYGKDPLGVALYLQQKELVLPIGLDYPKMLCTAIGGDEHTGFTVRFSDLEEMDMLEAVEQQLFDLKSNRTFYDNVLNDNYGAGDASLIEAAIRRRNAQYSDYVNSYRPC